MKIYLLVLSFSIIVIDCAVMYVINIEFFTDWIRSRREDCLGWEFNNRGPEIKDDIIDLEY